MKILLIFSRGFPYIPIKVYIILKPVVLSKLVMKKAGGIFPVLGPKLVLAYAEDILSDSRLKNCAEHKSG